MTTELKQRVDWADLDMFGHVNNVMYFKYMQASRLIFCEKLGLSTLNEPGKLSFIVASSRCDFVTPLRYPDEIRIETRSNWAKNSSFSILHTITDGMGQRSAEGEDVLVLFDYAHRRKVSLTDELRAKIAG